MIQKFDSKGFTGVFQPFCDLHIFPAWCKTACRVVVVIMKKIRPRTGIGYSVEVSYELT
jgi:hypothetical protein